MTTMYLWYTPGMCVTLGLGLGALPLGLGFGKIFLSSLTHVTFELLYEYLDYR